MNTICAEYSGIVLDQNQVVENTDDYVGTTVYQDFSLPDDYVRGSGTDAALIPSITGIQLFAHVTAQDVTFDWAVERYEFGVGWQTLVQASASGAPFVGDQWITLLLDAPLVLDSDIISDRFRIKVTPSSGGVFYSVPNPLQGRRAYLDGDPTQQNGVSPVTDGFREVSLRFRLLANVADSGTDFLGNPYRSVVASQGIDNASTAEGSTDGLWMSGPQPSQFAVVCNYFDMRQYGQPKVIDRILVDPVTPNVYFEVYYSNDDVDVTDFTTDDWDNLLWTHVPATFQAKRRETHALPSPISAKFIKIEYSHLQARPYSPGDYQKPIIYKKHPKWVLDYFLLRTELQNPTEDHFVANSVSVTFDALDLAYNYYLDDLRQEPDQPVQLVGAGGAVKNFLNTVDDASDQVDATTLQKIRTVFNTFASNPALLGKTDFLPTMYTKGTSGGSYPTEGNMPSLTATDTSVSVLNRDPVVFEQGFPVMFFFITCRHKYREVQASLDHDRAYFVGIREIQFDRDIYSSTFDQEQYVDTLADGMNAARNDLLKPDFSTQIVRT